MTYSYNFSAPAKPLSVDYTLYFIGAFIAIMAVTAIFS